MISLSGTYTALVTPFTKTTDGIDWPAYDRLLEHQLKGGISGVVPCGTTGESPTLSHDEQLDLIRRAVTVCRGKAQVIAGTGSNDTRVAVALARTAEEAGANAVMVVVPYYSKPTQEGLFAHYSTVAKAVRCPVVAYNVPSRTGADLLPETLARLAEACPNLVAVKEATGNVLRAQHIASLVGDRLTVLCGDDTLTLPMMAVGAKGVISVTSNLYPAEVGEVVRLAHEGSYPAAKKKHLALLPVHESMFIESNPVPCKVALATRGIVGEAVRLPLTPPLESTRTKMAAVTTAFERS